VGEVEVRDGPVPGQEVRDATGKAPTVPGRGDDVDVGLGQCRPLVVDRGTDPAAVEVTLEFQVVQRAHSEVESAPGENPTDTAGYT
jgi:hypothetical protein